MSTDKSINWEEVYERLETVRTMMAQGFTPSAEEQKRILKARAHNLARDRDAETDARDLLEVVVFELAGERYGLPLTSVREVSVLKDLTPVPCTPAFVLGIINLRGEIRTVIDLKKFFDLPASGITELNKAIIIRHAGLQIGVLADAIHGVRSIPHADLQSTLPTLTDVRADYLRGITSDRLIVLDPARILSDKRILVEEEVGV